MKFLTFILLSTIALATAENCSFKIDGEKYSRKQILDIQGLPTNLAYNNHTGDLFFTLIDIESLLNDEVETKMDEYVITNNVTVKIDNINGQTAVVDTAKGIVFFGSDSGLHVFDELTKTAVPIGSVQDDVVQLFKSPISDDLYAVLYPSYGVYLISEGGKVKTHINAIGSANIIAVDKEENIYFQSNSKYLSILLKGFEEPISYVGFKLDAARVLVANGGTILAATDDGLYELKPDNVIPKKVADFDFVPSGFAAYEDDIYISTSKKIFKYSRRDC